MGRLMDYASAWLAALKGIWGPARLTRRRILADGLLDGLELEGEGLFFAAATNAEFDAISDIMPV